MKQLRLKNNKFALDCVQQALSEKLMHPHVIEQMIQIQKNFDYHLKQIKSNKFFEKELDKGEGKEIGLMLFHAFYYYSNPKTRRKIQPMVIAVDVINNRNFEILRSLLFKKIY